MPSFVSATGPRDELAMDPTGESLSMIGSGTSDSFASNSL